MWCSNLRWEGIFVGSDLNDGEWQTVHMMVNDSHVFLAANNETTLHPINPVQTINSSDTSFSSTILGEATCGLEMMLVVLLMFLLVVL